MKGNKIRPAVVLDRFNWKLKRTEHYVLFGEGSLVDAVLGGTLFDAIGGSEQGDFAAGDEPERCGFWFLIGWTWH